MKLTPEKMTAFVAALAQTGIVAKACEAVDIARVTAYKWRDEHPEFAKAWDAALKIGITALEDEAARRAFTGVDKPLVHQGQFTPVFERNEKGEIIYDDFQYQVEVDGEMITKTEKRPRLKLDANNQPVYHTMKEYSDTLAIFLLKAHNPEKYRENVKIDVTGNLAITDRLARGRERLGRK